MVAAILSLLLTSCCPPSGTLPSAPPGPGCSSSGCASHGWFWEETPSGMCQSRSALPGHMRCHSSLPAGAVPAGLWGHRVNPRTRHPPQLVSTGTWTCSCPSCPPLGGSGTVLPLALAPRSQRSPHGGDEDNPLNVRVLCGHTHDRTLHGWPGGLPAAPASLCPCNDSSIVSPFQAAEPAAETPYSQSIPGSRAGSRDPQKNTLYTETPSRPLHGPFPLPGPSYSSTPLGSD